jgi:hypothetical protein
MSVKHDLNLWLLRGLHALIALSLPLLIFALAGCMKAKEQKEDLGPEVPVQNINDALSRVQDQASFDNLKIGQYLSFVDTRRVENGDTAILLGTKRIDVIDRTDTTAQARFTFKIGSAVRLADGKFETTISEEALWLDKVAAASAFSPANASPLGLKAPAGQKITAESLVHSRDATVNQPQRVTFHHLQESDGIVPVSDTIKARSDCAGLNPCEIPAHFLQFDMVIWADSSNYQKISFDFAYSLKTPFIPEGANFDQITGLMIVDCRSTYVPVEKRTVYVRDCLTLDNFQN